MFTMPLKIFYYTQITIKHVVDLGVQLDVSLTLFNHVNW